MPGSHQWGVEVSPAYRDAMRFDLIIGRTALKGRGIPVDPAHAYLSDLHGSAFRYADIVQNPGIPLIERKKNETRNDGSEPRPLFT